MDNDEALDMAKLLSTIGVIGGVIGICFNYGYFFWDLNSFTRLSFKDHLTSLIFFAPPCLLLALLWFAWRARGKVPDVVAVLLIIAVLFSLLWQTEAGTYANAPFNAVLFYLRGISSFVLSGYLVAVIFDFVDGKPEKMAILGLAMIGLIVFVAIFGNYWYHANLADTKVEVEVTLKGDDKSQARPQPAYLVRVIEDGTFLIFKDAPDRLVFVTKDEIRMLSKPVQP